MVSAPDYERLQAFALEQGVTEIVKMTPDTLVIDEKLRDLCQKGCPNYGQSIHCPPHLMMPADFQTLLSGYRELAVVKVDLVLEGSTVEAYTGMGQRIHHLTAQLEHEARRLGFSRACGYSSGGCKQTLCGDEPDCAALHEKGQCRHPETARPSLSGMGVDWQRLSASLGWKMMRTQTDENGEKKRIMMMGAILLLQ